MVNLSRLYVRFSENGQQSIADLAEASKFMIGPFGSHITMVSFKTTVFTKLHLVVDACVFTSQVM